jgi:hypothetical protein
MESSKIQAPLAEIVLILSHCEQDVFGCWIPRIGTVLKLICKNWMYSHYVHEERREEESE